MQRACSYFQYISCEMVDGRGKTSLQNSSVIFVSRHAGTYTQTVLERPSHSSIRANENLEACI